MPYIVKYVGILLILLSLSACNSVQNTQIKNDENTKIQTAKINTKLGIAYLERRDTIRAKKKLLLALRQAPNIPEPWYSMAYFLEATGDPQTANTYYLKAIALAPERGDSQNNYGTYLCRNGAYKTSISHFDLATKDPNYTNPADAFENAAACAMKIPNYAQAHYYFQRAIRYDEARPLSLISLAELNFMKKNYKQSHIFLKRFLIISPPTKQSKILMEKLLQVTNVST